MGAGGCRSSWELAPMAVWALQFGRVFRSPLILSYLDSSSYIFHCWVLTHTAILACLFGCLFVCLFLSNERQNGWTDRDQILYGTSRDPREGLWMIKISKIWLSLNFKSLWFFIGEFFIIIFHCLRKCLQLKLKISLVRNKRLNQKVLFTSTESCKLPINLVIQQATEVSMKHFTKNAISTNPFKTITSLINTFLPYSIWIWIQNL